jgi:hypothetical protein
MEKLRSGDLFKLNPAARVKWLAIRIMDYDEVKAVRTDSEYGKRVLAWMGAGRPNNDEGKALARDFGWSNPSTFQSRQLDSAVLCAYGDPSNH